MRREFLANLGLEQDLIEKIMAQYGSDVEKLKNQNKILTDNIENLTNELDGFKQKSIDSQSKDEKLSELLAQIEDLKMRNLDLDTHYKNKLRVLKISAAVDKALKNANAKNNKVVAPLLSDFLETAELDDDGNVVGLDNQIKALSENPDTNFLFDNKIQNPQGRTPGVGNNNQEDCSSDFSKMSYEQICETLKNKNKK